MTYGQINVREVVSYSWEVTDPNGYVLATGTAVTPELARERAEQARLKAEENWADDPSGD